MLEFILDLPLSSAAKTLMHTRHFIRRATTTTTLTTAVDPERKADSLPYTLHAHCSSNNTILTLSISSRSEAVWGYLGFERTPQAGRVVAQLSSGCCGFKGARRGTLEAGTQASVAMFRLIEKVMDKTLVVAGSSNEKDKDKKGILEAAPMQCLTIAVNGFGHGRNALFAALTSREGALVAERVRYLQDATPIKIGGSKPSKRRVL